MNPRNLGLAAAGLALALVLSLGLSHQARSQINASPSVVPVGVSASGTTSTAWFHEPSSRQAVACQTIVGANAALSGIKCVTTTLP